MGRYLLFFSYVGSRYHGLQRQIWQETPHNYIETVGGTLEKALACLKPSVSPHLVTSSRTDTGVHALSNTAHVDMDPSSESSIIEYCPKLITHTVNCYMKKNEHQIRVRKIMRVSADFHARFNALGRTYCYKLAKYRKSYDDVVLHPVSPISALDLRRCALIPVETDMERFRQGAEILCGTHNFSAFTGRLRHYQNPVKDMLISVHASGGSLDYLLDDDSRLLDHYDVLVTGNSFLHKQIRKMIGALTSYGGGKFSRAELHDILENPHLYRNSNDLIPCSQPSGLYLVNVHYDPNDLIYDPSRPPWQKKLPPET